MASASRKTKLSNRSRSSKRFCKEKFCCRSEETEARFHCFECDSDQCFDCDESIHGSNIKYEFHDRRLIEPAPADQLCQIHLTNANSTCRDINYADQRCVICDLNFCFACFDTFHKGTKKTHRKITFKEFQQRELQKALNDPVKPNSPVGNHDDDSLTYVTLPQTETDIPVIDAVVDSGETDSMTSFSSAKSDHSQPSSIPDICLSVENGEQTSLRRNLLRVLLRMMKTMNHHIMMSTVSCYLMIKKSCR